MKDPIAENQTELTISRLLNGSADDKIRDHATAALLSTVQTLAQELGEVKSSLWQLPDLERIIDKRHRESCDHCPARRQYEEEKNKKKNSKSVIEAICSPMVMLFIITILSLLTAVYTLTGAKGVESITDNAQEIFNPVKGK